MALDSEPKRWSMLAMASGAGRNMVFNPDSSGLVSIEKITVLRHYGGIAWGSPGGFTVAWAYRVNTLIGGY